MPKNAWSRDERSAYRKVRDLFVMLLALAILFVCCCLGSYTLCYYTGCVYPVPEFHFPSQELPQ